MLHCVLLLRRLEQGPDPPRSSARPYSTVSARTWTTACEKWAWAIWRCREKMRRIGEAFYGRQAAYRAALAVTGDEPLAAALERNVFAGALGEPDRRRRRLAAYVRAGRRGRLRRSRMASSAASSPSPIPSRCWSTRDRQQDDDNDQARAHVRGISRTSCLKRPWSVPVALSEVPETGRHLDLVADASGALPPSPRLAGLVALPRLEASFDVTPHGRSGLHVVGRVSATVGQTCVVTLEPIENEIDEPIDLVVHAGTPRTHARGAADGGEIEAPGRRRPGTAGRRHRRSRRDRDRVPAARPSIPIRASRAPCSRRRYRGR